MRKVVIGVMGPGDGATEADKSCAYELGSAIAQQGWILLTGGRNQGVMAAANQGAKSADGLTVGVLPTADDSLISPDVDIAIRTDMGNGRNNINVLSSDAVVACGMGTGTASEIALALKNGKPVILLNHPDSASELFPSLSPQQVYNAESPQKAMQLLRSLPTIP